MQDKDKISAQTAVARLYYTQTTAPGFEQTRAAITTALQGFAPTVRKLGQMPGKVVILDTRAMRMMLASSSLQDGMGGRCLTVAVGPTPLGLLRGHALPIEAVAICRALVDGIVAASPCDLALWSGVEGAMSVAMLSRLLRSHPALGAAEPAAAPCDRELARLRRALYPAGPAPMRFLRLAASSLDPLAAPEAEPPTERGGLRARLRAAGVAGAILAVGLGAPVGHIALG